MKKHILVISQYFYPEQFRINDICTEWVKRGFQVTVLTGIPNYPQGRFYKGYGIFKKRRETYNGVDIIRIPLIPRGNNPIMLALNYISFVISGFFWKLFTNIKADYVFIFEVSPMTQALPGVWYANKLQIPCYLYVQDLWPENVEIITGIKNKMVIGAIGKMVDYIYENCTKIFTTSRSFIDSISDRGVPLSKLEYWPQYAEDFYVPLERKEVKEIPNDGRFNITFTGNIGQAQGLDILPITASILKKKHYSNQVRFNIIGDGRYKDTLISKIKEYKVLDMFNFIPKQPPERIPEFLAASDAALLTLSDSPIFKMTIPAKLQSYMACGIPIIASASGETEKILKRSNSGLCSIPGNPQMLADNIIHMINLSDDKLVEFGKNARIYYEENFDKDMLLNRIERYFQ